MTQAARIIEKFGGTRAMATALGKAPSTVQFWKGSGFIPAKHHGDVLHAARSRGIDLQPADFFEAVAQDERAA